MSRSYKKHPKGKACWVPANFSEKEWKQTYNRKIRRKIATIIRSNDMEDIDDMSLVSRHCEFENVYNSKSDGGKRYFGDLKLNKIEFSPMYTIDYKNCSKPICITEKNIDTVLEENNIPGDLHHSIVWHVKSFGQYWYREIVSYKLIRTMEDTIKEYKELYAKMMRK